MIHGIVILIIQAVIVVVTVLFGWRAKLFKALHWRRIFIVQLCVLLLISISQIPVSLKDQAADASNLDLMFLVDNTYSMNAFDGADGKSRMDTAKADIQAIVDKAQGARVGIMSFDYKTHIYLPLTNSGNDLTVALATLHPQDTFDSTSVMKTSDAVAEFNTYVSAIKQKEPTRSRIAIMLSDFELTAKNDSDTAVHDEVTKLATTINGFSIGLGSSTPVQLPSMETNYETYKYEEVKYDGRDPGVTGQDASGNYGPVKSTANPDLGKNVGAALGGGNAQNNDTATIDSLLTKSSTAAVKRTAQSPELKQLNQSYFYAIWAALFFLLLATLEYRTSSVIRRLLKRLFA